MLAHCSADSSSTINVECRARDVTRLVRGKETHHVRNVLWLADATKGNCPKQSLSTFRCVIPTKHPTKPVQDQFSASRNLCRWFTHIAVSPTAGRIQLNLIPSAAYSAARPFVACMYNSSASLPLLLTLTLTTVTAPLLLAYHTTYGRGRGSLILLKFTNNPFFPVSFHHGTITFVLKYSGFTFTRNTRSNSSSSISWLGPARCTTPAQFTTASRRSLKLLRALWRISLQAAR